MTREIKFRIPMFTDKGTFIEFQYLKLGDDIEGTLCGHNGEPQQYTNLKDKNGKEIYFGDIVKVVNCGCGKEICDSFTPNISKVTFSNACIFPFGDQMQGETYQNSTNYEIIGNINENPNLLK